MNKSLKSSVIDITPKLAAQWLKTIKKQRPVNEATVGKYVHQIIAGDWQLNGETIKFNGDGSLLDGQHRLRAIVATKKTCKSVVVRGIADKAIGTIDTGRNRDVRDLMVYEGVKDASFALASAARWIYRLETDPRQVGRYYGANTEVMNCYRNSKGLHDSIKFGRLARGVIRSEAIGIALHYLFRQKDADLADTFLLGIAEGTGLTKEDLVYHLRERLLKNAMSKAKLHRKDIMAAIIKCWNALRQGKFQAPRQTFAWVGRGPQAEDFPTIK